MKPVKRKRQISQNSNKFSTEKETSTGSKEKTVTYTTDPKTGKVTKTVTKAKDEKYSTGKDQNKPVSKSSTKSRDKVISAAKAARQIKRKAKKFTRKGGSLEVDIPKTNWMNLKT